MGSNVRANDPESKKVAEPRPSPWFRGGETCAGETVLHRRSDVREQPDDGETVLFDPLSRRTFYLNETALHVWRDCDGRRTLLDIARRQASRYGIDLDDALDDVEQIVVTLAEAGLIGAEPPRAGPPY